MSESVLECIGSRTFHFFSTPYMTTLTKTKMPSFLLDLALTGAGIAYASKLAGGTEHPKKLRILAVFIGLIVFVQIPYYFDNIDDTGDEAADYALETAYDTLRASLRFTFAVFVFLSSGIAIAVA